MNGENEISVGGDMTLVPWRSTAPSPQDDLYDFFDAGNESILDSAKDFLVVTGGTSVLCRETINPDVTYRLVKGGVSEVPGGGGNVRGVVWRSGEGGKGIREFSEFRQVGEAAKLASTFFSQGMLIYIAAELNDIKKGISEIQNELFASEVSKMKGLIDSAGRALRYYRRNEKTNLVDNAIQPLGAEIVPLLEAIVRQVQRLPTETSLFGVGAGKIKQSYDQVLSAVAWLLKGIVVLCLLYSVHDAEFGRSEMARLLGEVAKNGELSDWFEKVGRTLAMKGYGEKYYDQVVGMKESVTVQRKLLSEPDVGMYLTGRQLLQLEVGRNKGPAQAARGGSQGGGI